MDLFAYDTGHWVRFFVAAFLLNLSPGPDIAYIAGRAVHGGTNAGLRAMMGVWTGTLVHVLLAAAGISAVIVASAALFTLVQLVGAAFLIYIGVRSFLFQPGPETPGEPERTTGGDAPYRGGILVSALNPKVALFFLAFLPQFVVPAAGPVPLQFLLHGMLVIAVAALVEPAIVLIVARGARSLRRSAKAALWIERALARSSLCSVAASSCARYPW